MEYQGTWNANTNTPTLANGTGNQGDVYLCNVAGTTDFGAGPIAFVVSDQVIYSGSIWQKASGSNGTVTSVAVTESGDALTITGSPITTSGTINIGFAGISSQYVAGNGSLVTFPSLTGYVPYTGATANVDLGTFNLTADVITGATGSFASNGGSDTFAINHSSGAGIALNITKGGSGEGLYINKTSGSGNAATIIGTLNATTLVKSGGTSSQFLKADGSVDTSTYLTTSAAASTYLPLTGGTLSGLLNISTASYLTSRLKLTNTATGGNIWSVSSGNANNSINNSLFTIINETLSKNTFVLSPTGKLAIGENLGTINPSDALSVYDTNTILRVFDLTGNGSSVVLQATDTASYVNAAYNTTAIPLILRTANTTRLTIAATGEATFTGAIIGTTSTFTNAGSGIGVGITNSSTGDGLKITHSAGRALQIASSATGFGILINNDTASTSAPFTIQKSGSPVITMTDAGGLTLAGALGGTSATFSATITSGTGSGNTLSSGSIDVGKDVGLAATQGIVVNNARVLAFASTGAATFSNLAGTGSRAVLADANGLLSAPVSDISVKENIIPIGYGLNEILKMNPVWFDYINDYKNYGEGRQNGNIAQDIEKIIPEAVFVTPTNGKMGINYDQLHAVYIKAIQELKAEIDELKNK
jgi:hypothetical protein